MTRILAWALAFVAAFSSSAAAQTAPTLYVKSKYFAVLGPPHMDVLGVLQRMKVDYFLHVDNILNKAPADPARVLGETVDAVFLETAMVLGIHVYSFQATLEFLDDERTLKIVIRNVAGVDIHERAFYLHEAKTIYVSIDRLTAGVLGHEMAHALISYYFGAPPAENIQEILAGYVDFTLTKKTQQK